AATTLLCRGGTTGGRDGLSGSLQPTAPGGANAQFIDQLYQDFLNRQADPAGLAFWTAQIDQGMTRAQVAAGIEGSQEFQTVTVQKAYQQFLQRAADPAGLSFWTGFLRQGNTIEQMDAGIVGSAEYFQTRGGGTNNGFLTAPYQDALGRAVDPAGQNSFTQQLPGGVTNAVATAGGGTAGGMTTAQVAGQVFASAEFQQGLVKSDYALLLNRAADNAPSSARCWTTTATPS